MSLRDGIGGAGRERRAAPPLRVPAAAARVLLAVLVAAGCAATGGAPGPEEPPPRVAPELVPAFEALEAAVWAREEALARRILASLRARPLGAAEEELAEKFERVLDGRAVLAAVDLWLEIEPVEDEPGRRLLSLVALNGHSLPVVLDLPPATLRRKTTVVGLALTDDGLAAHDAQHLETDHFDALGSGFTLEPGVETRLELLEFDLSAGGYLAVRDRWTLEMRSGELRMGGEAYPAQEPRVEGADAVALARWLPAAPLEPAELARYAQGVRVSAGGLLERAVRIPSERRDEAVEVLRELEPELDDARLAELVPALRWLSGSVLPGADPRAWRRWLRYRGERAEPGALDRGLDLPAPPRSRAPAR